MKVLRDEDYALLEKWRLSKIESIEAKKVVEAERHFRGLVINSFYDEAKEGVNTLDLTLGWKLKYTHKVDRDIDKVVIQSVLHQLKKLGVNTDALVEWEPKLKLSAYRELTAEQRDLLDSALIIKEGSPTLVLNPPKGSK